MTKARNKLLDDSELFYDFSIGNDSAFEQLFHRFYPSLCYFAERILNDADASEDLVQDILLKAWQKRSDFNNFASFRSFLYTGVRNAAFNVLDRQKVAEKHESSIATTISVNDRHSQLQLLIESETVRQLYAVVDTLPEQCRKVIRMTFEHGMKPAEIAKELGVSVSTVNNQKMRGLCLLRTKLSDQDLGVALLILSLLGHR
ncbi:MAG: RNA polymerase sigma-70 factor [Mucilaginibacter sp.]|nr:RNA polymerase sigma-70 factor [Mucilaginibacter sp.]